MRVGNRSTRRCSNLIRSLIASKRLLIYARENLHKELSVEQLAEVAHLSPRQFSRAFQAETGQSPAKAIENLRVEAARLMIENGRIPIDTIARDVGFGDRERMRRAFLRAFGQPPRYMQRNARNSRLFHSHLKRGQSRFQQNLCAQYGVFGLDVFRFIVAEAIAAGHEDHGSIGDPCKEKCIVKRAR